MRFIKLTTTENKTIYIDSGVIVEMERTDRYEGGYTTIRQVSGQIVNVYEKPEDILKRLEAEIL